MADNKVLIELIISEKGTKARTLTKDTEKLSKSTDKVDKSRKKLSRTSDNYHKKEKALHQTNLSSAKGFSKMKETMGGGGSSGLVAAYATLAANVFAATAAFNALRNAAQVQTLVEGFTVLAAESGRTATVITANLKSIAQGALSTEEAMRAAALAVSSGFSTNQLKELTEVATNASIALGRNLGDSVDRLIRGVAKLEPEILDELGIMVRLDTATEKYAATIGKSVSALTDFERRQAFLNESITQGQEKFSLMADEVELSPFEKLGATFSDLGNNVLGFITTAFGPLISIISNSQIAMLGLLTMFGSGILTSMIPALSNLGAKQAQRAVQLRENADLEMKDAEAMRQSAKAALDKGQESSLHKRRGRRKLTELGDKAGVKEYRKELNLVQRDINTMAKNRKKYGKAETARRKRHLEELKAYKRELAAVIRKEEKRNKLLMKGGKNERNIMGGDASARASERIGDTQSSGGLFGQYGKASEGYAIAKEEMGAYMDKMNKSKGVQDKLSKGTGRLAQMFNLGAKASMFAGTGVRIFGAALLNAIPFIGQIIFAISLIIQGFQKLFGASEKAKEAQKNYDAVIESSAEKQEQLSRTIQKYASNQIANTGGMQKQAVAGFELAAALKVAAGSMDELSSATMALNNVIAEEGTGVWGTIFAFAETGLSSLGNGISWVGDKISGWWKNTDAGEFIQKNIDDVGTYQKIINNLNDAEKDYQKILDKLPQSETLATVSQNARIKSMSDIVKANTLTAQWNEILIEANGDMAKAYKIARREGISLADAQLVLNNVQGASTIEMNRQVSAITDLGKTFTNAGKSWTKLETNMAKKNAYRESADNFQTLATQVAEVNTILADNPEGLAGILANVEKNLGETEKKLLRMVGGTGDFTSQVENLNEKMQDLATKEEEYAEAKKMQQLFLANAKAAQTAELAYESLRVKTEGLAKTGQFKITAEGEIDTAFKVAAIKRAGLEYETEAKIALVTLEYDLLDAKLALNTKLFEEDGKTLTAQGARLTELARTSRRLSLDTINQTANAAKDGITATLAAAKSGAGQKGTTVERIQSLTKIRQNPEELAARKAGAEEQARIFAQAYDETQNELFKEMQESALKRSKNMAKIMESEGLGKAILGGGNFKETIHQFRGVLGPAMEDLKKLGPEGELVAQVMSGSLSIADSIDTLSAKGDEAATTAEKFAAVASIIGQVNAMLAASSKARIAAIDKEIAAEQKRDGKSKASLQRIASLEKKKDAMAKKAFERNKKMMIAQAIASTAAGVVATLGNAADGPTPVRIAMAALIGAMGLAQVAIIQKQQYQGASTGGASVPQTISVGKRSNKVDVSQGASSGELSYLRGEQGIGTNANNFRGAAVGMKNYATGSFVAGEQGPEVVTPAGSVDVIPNDKLGGQNLNANITINAVDAAGVAEVLEGQKGNIINMLQQAAHEHGEEFIEAVNPASYSGGTGG